MCLVPRRIFFIFFHVDLSKFLKNKSINDKENEFYAENMEYKFHK